MKKRILILALSILLLFSCLPTALADDTPQATEIPQVTETPQPTETPAPILSPEPSPEVTVTPEPTVEPTEDPIQFESEGTVYTLDATSGDYDYSVNIDGISATITKYSGTATDVVIPDTLGGYNVTKIGVGAFGNNRTLKRIVVPEGITNIENSAFADSPNITEILLPDSLENIGDNVFCNCYSLNSITIPKNVKSIGTDAFLLCCLITGINVDDSNAYYSSQDGVLFDKAKTVLIKYPGYNVRTDYVVPNTVKEISAKAFYETIYLKILTVQNGVESIGDKAFWGSQIACIKFPASLASIGDEAFIGCSLLVEINVDASNASYCSQDGILFNKSKTTLIDYPDSNRRKDYSVPEGVTEIYDNALEYAFYLSTIRIPASVSIIGEHQFEFSSSFTEINVDAGNTAYSSQDGVLFDKDKTRLIRYPCANPRSSYTIPDSVTTADACSFQYSGNLRIITIPSGMCEISDLMFKYCYRLSAVFLPDGIKRIGLYAFGDCLSFNKILIPDSLNEISDYAFSGCKNLRRVYFEGNAPTLNVNIFEDCSEVLTVNYLIGKTGFTNPWYGYPAAAYDPGSNCVVNFNSQGGSEVPKAAAVFGSAVDTPSDPARYGYSFSGWYLNPGCVGDPVGFPYMLTENETLYAKWTPNTYTVNFNSCGGSYVSHIKAEYGSSIPAPQPPEKDGYAFAGWYMTTEFNTDAVTFPYIITGDVNLYAKWIYPGPTGTSGDYEYWAKDGKATILKYRGAERAIVIPAYIDGNAVTTITARAFSDQVNMISVTIPNSVTCIKAQAFCGCYSLTSVKLPDNLTYIGDSAFYACTNIKTITIPASVTNIGQSAFGYCVNLKKAYFMGSAPVVGAIGVPSNVFWGCAKDFTVYYISGKTGFTNPWYECPTAVYDPSTAYTVSFYASSIKSYAPPIYTAYGASINEPSQPVLPGCYFAGWYLTPHFITPRITFPYTVYDDLTFYAKWQKMTPYLAGINLSAGNLSHSFLKTTTSYKITLGEFEEGVTLTPVPEFDGATVMINGKPRSSYYAPVANGKSVKVTVKVAYGKTSKTYTFTVTRAKSTNNALSSLSANAGTWSQPFDPNVTSYTLTLPEGVKSATIKASAAAGRIASVSPATSKVTLNNGQSKTIRVTVKAQSGAKRTYTIMVTRAASTNANLKSLRASVKGLTPAFSPGNTEYSLTIPASANPLVSVMISAGAAGYKAKVSVNGTGKAAAKVALAAGETKVVPVVVTAQDTGVVKTYNITITRQ